MLQRSPVHLDVLVSALRARKLLHEAASPLHPKEFVKRISADWETLIAKLEAKLPLKSVQHFSICRDGQQTIIRRPSLGYVKNAIIPFLLFHSYILRVCPPSSPGESEFNPHLKHIEINGAQTILPEHFQRIEKPFHGSFYESAYPRSIPVAWVSLLHKGAALTISPLDDMPQQPALPEKRQLLKDRFAYHYVRTTAEMSRKERHTIKTGNRIRKYQAKKALREERARLRMIQLIRKSSNTARNILRMKLGEEKYSQLFASATSKGGARSTTTNN